MDHLLHQRGVTRIALEELSERLPMSPLSRFRKPLRVDSRVKLTDVALFTATFVLGVAAVVVGITSLVNILMP